MSSQSEMQPESIQPVVHDAFAAISWLRDIEEEVSAGPRGQSKIPEPIPASKP
ncbi:hypothetical protein [Frankia nepalensis]|uniref:Uncharacterized protein n=1 Tax=Frankia nepalensis TaxID=1836974 RepID=A0A937UQF0_9ACTN|nr:hypothetical protein [Frankia nepalensis]MBL7500273.1 hypothetical protein [Frankia nepalensis]MBL7511974.1 hypothetical protein [Frankia nepalensis]MBL7631784.1 hypothetical protein [Frankia nepalensis]